MERPKCDECSYTGLTWLVTEEKIYEGALGSCGKVCYGDDNLEQTEFIVKCPECGAWNDGLSSECILD